MCWLSHFYHKLSVIKDAEAYQLAAQHTIMYLSQIGAEISCCKYHFPMDS